MSTKRALFTTVSALALGYGAARLLLRSPRRCRAAPEGDGPRSAVLPPQSATSGVPPTTEEITRSFLLYFIVPLWLAAGVADWICHRAAHIETTTGAKESLIHLLMMIEVGVPVLAALFLEITEPVLALMIVSLFLHEATALWDVSYAITRREVTPIEQHVHSFLEMVPLMALSFIVVLHWRRFRALLGLGDEAPDWSLRLKEDALPTHYVIALLEAMGAFEAVPYLEEFWRGLRASGGRLVPPRMGGRSADSFAQQHGARYDPATGLVHPAEPPRPAF